MEEDTAGKSQKEIYEEVEIETNVAKKRGQDKDQMRKNQLTGIYRYNHRSMGEVKEEGLYQYTICCEGQRVKKDRH